MYVAESPSPTSNRFQTVSFVAGLKSIKPRRKNGSDVIERYEIAIGVFIRELSLKVFGVEYTDLTGEILQASFTIVEGQDERPNRVYTDILCPSTWSVKDLKAAVVQAWTDCPMAGNSLFFGGRSLVYEQGSNSSKGIVFSKADEGASPRGWWQRTFGT